MNGPKAIFEILTELRALRKEVDHLNAHWDALEARVKAGPTEADIQRAIEINLTVWKHISLQVLSDATEMARAEVQMAAGKGLNS